MILGKIRVLIITPNLEGLGGVANYYKGVSPYLKDEQFVVDQFVVGSVKSNNKFLHPITDQINFYEKLQKNKYDLIHINPSLNLKSFIRDGLLLLQAKRKKLPVVTFIHGWDEKFSKLIDFPLRYVFRSVFGKTTAFIVLASRFKKKLQDWGIKSPIYLETTNVDDNLLEGFDIGRRVLQIKQTKSLRILYLARIEREKGVFETVDAVRTLHERGFNITLTIAGDGPVRKELEDYVNGLTGLTNCIFFAGYIRGQEKKNVFMNHDIYCFPTYFGEGLPTSVLEALAFGLPVITCPTGGLADIFEDTKMGAFVPPRDPDSIVKVLSEYLANREKTAMIAQYNYQQSMRFYASNVAKKLLSIFSETVENFER